MALLLERRMLSVEEVIEAGRRGMIDLSALREFTSRMNLAFGNTSFSREVSKPLPGPITSQVALPLAIRFTGSAGEVIEIAMR